MRSWFTSDTHFGHSRILAYAHRPFANVDEMDEALIRNWNSVVGERDDVYHLGDMMFRLSRERAEAILGRLRGRIHLEDHGIGVPAADAERIFEPFERGSNVGEIKGTGLGLNIVKKMTQKLDGKIVVTPNEGGGSCFTISLPRRSVPDGYAS